MWEQKIPIEMYKGEYPLPREKTFDNKITSIDQFVEQYTCTTSCMYLFWSSAA